MSNQSNNPSSYINEDSLKQIEDLNLSVYQKHHVRLLCHCLHVFREILAEKETKILSSNDLKLWTDKQSARFDDKVFSDSLFRQMCIARSKLEEFSLKNEKDLQNLVLDDLVSIINQNHEEELDDPKEKM